jgi:RNA polymerase sigma factor (sigma-70 family)
VDRRLRGKDRTEVGVFSSVHVPPSAARQLSDERLVALAREGDDSAFAAIVERYRPQLLAFARRTGSDGRAEDVVQQALLDAFAALRADNEVVHLRGWLHQIVRHAAHRSARRSPPHAVLDADAGAPAAVDASDTRLLAVSALEAVADLPERQRDAFVRTAIQGRSRAEVASAMGLSEGAVRQLVARARLSVRSAVAVLTPYPLSGWLSALREAVGPGRVADLTAGAGAAGPALKFAAVIASGVLAAGALTATTHSAHLDRAPRHHPAVASTPTSTRAVAAVPLSAPPPSAAALSLRDVSRPASAALPARRSSVVSPARRRHRRAGPPLQPGRHSVHPLERPAPRPLRPPSAESTDTAGRDGTSDVGDSPQDGGSDDRGDGGSAPAGAGHSGPNSDGAGRGSAGTTAGGDGGSGQGSGSGRGSPDGGEGRGDGSGEGGPVLLSADSGGTGDSSTPGGPGGQVPANGDHGATAADDGADQSSDPSANAVTGVPATTASSPGGPPGAVSEPTTSGSPGGSGEASGDGPSQGEDGSSDSGGGPSSSDGHSSSSGGGSGSAGN